MKYLKTFESNDWVDSVLDTISKEEYSDGYFTMRLDDMNYQGDDMILNVSFFETNDSQHNGFGQFKYSPSDIEGLSGDIVPMKMDGILQEIFYDEEEIIYDFVQRLVDQLS